MANRAPLLRITGWPPKREMVWTQRFSKHFSLKAYPSTTIGATCNSKECLQPFLRPGSQGRWGGGKPSPG
jgi:hypothetical protein